MNKADAEAYLQKHFEYTWKHFDVNNEGKIFLGEAHNFYKSLMGSFSITYSDEWWKILFLRFEEKIIFKKYVKNII